jgi:hypothetical protein
MDSVIVEAIAVEVSSGVNKTQQDNQGIPQGSPSVPFPSPTFNMPPREHAQALHRNLAAELTHAGSGRSPLIPPARHSQEPGTAIPMSTPTFTRRNNPNSSLQVQDSNRTVEELRLQAPRDNLTVGEAPCSSALHRVSKRATECLQCGTGAGGNAAQVNVFAAGDQRTRSG